MVSPAKLHAVSLHVCVKQTEGNTAFGFLGFLYTLGGVLELRNRNVTVLRIFSIFHLILFDVRIRGMTRSGARTDPKSCMNGQTNIMDHGSVRIRDVLYEYVERLSTE